VNFIENLLGMEKNPGSAGRLGADLATEPETVNPQFVIIKSHDNSIELPFVESGFYRKQLGIDQYTCEMENRERERRKPETGNRDKPEVRGQKSEVRDPACHGFRFTVYECRFTVHGLRFWFTILGLPFIL